MSDLESRDDEREVLESEDPDAADLEQADESEWIECPECGKPIHEDADRCAYCGEWVTDTNSRKGWALIGVLLVIAATLATWMW